MFYVSWWWWCASVARFQQIPLPAPSFFLQRYKSSLKTGPAWPGHVKIARDITHQRQQHIVTFHYLDTIMLLPFVYWKRYLWSRLAPPTNLVNWSKRSDRLFEHSHSHHLFERFIELSQVFLSVQFICTALKWRICRSCEQCVERLHNVYGGKNLWNWTKPTETSRISVVRDAADQFWGWQQLTNYRDPEKKIGALGGDILKKQRFFENYAK